jgi:hypothetical protein
MPTFYRLAVQSIGIDQDTAIPAQKAQEILAQFRQVHAPPDGTGLAQII